VRVVDTEGIGIGAGAMEEAAIMGEDIAAAGVEATFDAISAAGVEAEY
jgi:hypothetical protein